MLLQFLEKRIFPYKDCFTQTSKDFNQFANSGLEQMLHFLFRFCHKRASLLRTFLTQLFYRDSLTHCLLTFLFSIVVSQFLVSESKSKLTPKEFFPRSENSSAFFSVPSWKDLHRGSKTWDTKGLSSNC